MSNIRRFQTGLLAVMLGVGVVAFAPSAAAHTDDLIPGQDGHEEAISFTIRRPRAWKVISASAREVTDGILEVHGPNESYCPPSPKTSGFRFRLVRMSDGASMGTRDVECRGFVEIEWLELETGEYYLEVRKLDGNRSLWYWRGHIPLPENR